MIMMGGDQVRHHSLIFVTHLRSPCSSDTERSSASGLNLFSYLMFLYIQLKYVKRLNCGISC